MRGSPKWQIDGEVLARLVRVRAARDDHAAHVQEAAAARRDDHERELRARPLQPAPKLRPLVVADVVDEHGPREGLLAQLSNDRAALVADLVHLRDGAPDHEHLRGAGRKLAREGPRAADALRDRRQLRPDSRRAR
jgi:hypothetical protein